MSEGSSEREHQADQGIVAPLTILTTSSDLSQHPSTFLSDGNNKSTGTISGNQGVRTRLVHSVSIVVEPVLDDNEDEEEGVGGFEGEGEEQFGNVEESCDDERESFTRRKITTADTEDSQQRLVRKERIHSSPIIVMDDHFFGESYSPCIWSSTSKGSVNITVIYVLHCLFIL